VLCRYQKSVILQIIRTYNPNTTRNMLNKYSYVARIDDIACLMPYVLSAPLGWERRCIYFASDVLRARNYDHRKL
jgi:hypothetical protein